MKERRFFKLFLILGLGTATIGGFIFTPLLNGAKAHSPVVHSRMAESAADLYSNFHPYNKLSPQERSWIAQGAYEEDVPASRAMYHFYDPINNEGISGYTSSKIYANDPVLQSAFGLGGVYTWDKAIEAYAKGDREYAYKALGHVMHLVQDASVPSHTRQDPHPPKFESILGGQDPFEQKAKDLEVPYMGNMEPLYADSLDDMFDKVAMYSNTGFLSFGSIGKYDNPVPVRIQDNYIYTNNDGDEYRIAKIEGSFRWEYNDKQVDYNVGDPLVIQDYWERLAPLAVESGAGVIELFHREVGRYKEEQQQYSQSGGFLYNAFSGLANIGQGINNTMSGTTYYISQMASFIASNFGGSVQVGVSPMYGDASLGHLGTGFSWDISYTPNITAQEQQALNAFNNLIFPLAPPSLPSTETEIETTSPEIQEEDETDSEPQQEQEEGEQDEEVEQEDLYLVARVIDGDTVVLEDGERVRLIGIDAPELPNGCFAQEATDYLTELIENEHVRLEEGPRKRDIYDRRLSYIYLGGTNINALLVATGHAYAFNFGHPHPHEEEFRALYEYARENHLGLWGRDECRPGGSPSRSRSSSETSSQTESEEEKTEEATEEEPEFQDFTTKEVVINEIAWMGTSAGATHQWIELYNNTSEDIDLSGWQLVSSDGSPNITIGEDEDNRITVNSTISANGYYILEWRSASRMNEPVITTLEADWHGTFGVGGLKNAGEDLFLKDPASTTIDEVTASDEWFGAGNNETKQTMERVDSMGYGSDPANWASNNIITRNGEDAEENSINGTPGEVNSVSLERTNIYSKPFHSLLREYGELTLTKLGSPYVEAFGLKVPSGTTLKIEPGVTIKARSGSSVNGGVWRISGTMLAEGTEDEKITIQGRSDMGLWCGMQFHSSSEGSILKHVEVRGAYFSPNGCSGALTPHHSILVRGGLTIENSEIVGGNRYNKINLRSAKYINIEDLTVRYVSDNDSAKPVAGNAEERNICDIKVITTSGGEVIHTPPCDDEEEEDKEEPNSEEEDKKEDEGEHDCEVPYVCEEPDEKDAEEGDDECEVPYVCEEEESEEKEDNEEENTEEETDKEDDSDEENEDSGDGNETSTTTDAISD